MKFTQNYKITICDLVFKAKAFSKMQPCANFVVALKNHQQGLFVLFWQTDYPV